MQLSARMKLSEILQRNVEVIGGDATVRDAGRRMRECQIQRLLVVDHSDNLVRIVSLADLVRARGNAPAAARALEDIKAPTKFSAKGVTQREIGR